MSQYRPAIGDLLITVQQLLNECGPKLRGEGRYHALVGSYLLGICERELHFSREFDRQEAEQLQEFMGQGGTLAELNQALRRNVRTGLYDDRWEELLDLVLTQTINNVRVVRADHLAPEHRAADPASA